MYIAIIYVAKVRKGDVGMKKLGSAIAGILLLTGISQAAVAVSSAAVVSETSLPPMGMVTAILNSAASSPEPFSVTETFLPISNYFPLMAMDLYPEPVKSQPARDYSSMNLNPKAAVLGAPAFRPQVNLSGLGDTMYDLSLVAYLALNVADYLSTRECLKYPGLSEGNPVMKPFVKNPYSFAAVKAGLSVVSYLTMKSLYKKSKPLAWVVSLASNMALSYAVSNNYRLLGQAKARVS